MADVTIIATAAISGGIGLTAAGLQAGTSRRQMALEDRGKKHQEAEERRRERRAVYEAAMDLLSDFQWDLKVAGSDYDVVTQFTKPFLRIANRIRIYGSPESVAAIDEIQRGFALPDTESDEQSAWATVNRGIDLLYEAARNDVGPREEDRLQHVDFHRGAGPRLQ